MSKTYKVNSSVYLGGIGVDSGQILITDPCYIESNLDEKKRIRC